MKTVIFQINVNGQNFVPTREGWNKVVEENEKFLDGLEDWETQNESKLFGEEGRMRVYAQEPYPYPSWFVRFFTGQGIYALTSEDSDPLEMVVKAFRSSAFCPDGAEIRVLRIRSLSSVYDAETVRPNVEEEPLLEWYLRHVEKTWTEIGSWLLELARDTCGQQGHRLNYNGGLQVAGKLAAAVVRLPLGEFDPEEVERLTSLRTFGRIFAQLNDRLQSAFSHSWSPYRSGCRIEIRQLAVIWSQVAYLRLGE